ncbi:MAG: hypothetical protein ACRENI_11135 [Gemmatimonadaceae bacterium]
MIGSGRRGMLLLAAVLTAACTDDDAAAGEGPYAREVAEAVPRIEEAMGIPFREPPRLEVRSTDELRGFLEAQFREENSQREIVGLERAYKLFGFLPDTLDLRPFLLDLLTEQVVGYYDPESDVLYVVENASEELVGLTIIHELIHALQDQYIDLDSIQSVHGLNDRQTAAQAVIEGQATFESIVATLGTVGTSDLSWDRMRDVIRQESSRMPLFAAAPLVIQETLIFPYLSGAEFVRRYEARFPGETPYERMPLSTEQVMHEDAYFGRDPDAPTVVELPDPLRGESVYENSLGEFETRLLLYEHLRDQPASVRGAAGWDGDRYMVVETDAGDVLVWVSVWDSPVDAAEFHDLLNQLVLERYPDVAEREQGGGGGGGGGADGGAVERSVSGDVRIYDSAERTLMVRAAQVEGEGDGEDERGRAVIIFADAPLGEDPNIIDSLEVELDTAGEP